MVDGGVVGGALLVSMSTASSKSPLVSHDGLDCNVLSLLASSSGRSSFDLSFGSLSCSIASGSLPSVL